MAKVKVKLSNVRIAFCQSLRKAGDYQGNKKFRHSATFLIEPGSANDKAINAAITSSATDALGKRTAAVLEGIKGNNMKYCYQKGDAKEYDGFEGMMALAGHRKQDEGRPLLIGRDTKLLSDDCGKPYAGCKVNATVEIYYQDGTHNGVRCGLLTIQFFEDGDSFSGAGRGSADEFEDLGDGAAADFGSSESVDDFA